MHGRFPRLEQALASSPVIDKNGYPYFINPISDGIPKVDPELLEEVRDGLLELCGDDFDVLLAPEAMGIHIATAMSLSCRKPFSVIRKRRYGIPGEIEVQYRTGYSESKMYVNGISEGERVVIVDDVVSTGGTLTALSRELSTHGIEVVRAVIVFDKTKDMQEVLDRTRIDIRTMIRVEVRDGRPVVL